MKKLWTRDFSILTIGTVVSIFGNSFAGFAINLTVLDYSNSIFLFVLYMVVFNLPKILVPMLAGPFLDSFSRRKTIYTIDFISTAIFVSLFFILRDGYFNYIFFLFVSLTLGTIDSFYLVAYESLYPVLVAEGNYRKAYSVSSMLMPLSMVMMPVAAFLYERVGAAHIFLFSAIAFLIAACLETQIRADETHLREKSEKYSFSEFKASFIEGVEYIKGEKGLLVITLYFFVSMFAGSSQSLILPYFRNTQHLGIMLYSLVMSSLVLGRLIGGMIQYKLDLPKNKKFLIAMSVYVTYCFIEMSYLFTPVYVMAILGFISGLLTVTSYNIRISTTQSYIPDAKRARFNGAFHMIMNAGMILGQLIAGALADIVPIRAVVVIFNAICLVAAFGIMWRGRRHVMPIYNQIV
jgi:MFS family permease